MASRKVYIGIGTASTLTAVLLWIALNQNFILTASGDITCAGTPFYDTSFNSNISDCQVFWNITSSNFTYYFQNKKGIALGFNPKVKDYSIYVKESKGWISLNKSGEFTYKKGIKYQFMAFVFKDSNQTIKWTITAADVTKDPILFGIEDIPLEEEPVLLKDCINSTISYEIKTYDKTYSYTDNQTEIVYSNTTSCKNSGFNIKGKILDYSKFGWKCNKNGLFISCDAPYQSNQNGICESGEKCIKIDTRDLSIQNIGDSPTQAIKELRIE